ncbi:ATP-binding protein [Caulobacter segnis]|uniref:ATP-binding protein n=1 Tax=Caulobacter segnis TaxID=88688 RepID=UPI00240F988B|nr:ATP-binding protein [Caulobacter segnis]MDG2521208.1 ATP-binding protein [Caulobacter segnis]
MISTVAFQTKARTVDHLGREQIADCPTAISELWKNAFDAYARTVALDIYGGSDPVAVVSDDGHGMNRFEFENRWLVVGTESKALSDRTPLSDRNGLQLRPRQGQKGIGRLSCANLGPILLLVSKRRETPFVAALVDWRLFENPFLNLVDIQVPVAEFEHRDELLPLLPQLSTGLARNVTGGEGEEARTLRLRAAWQAYDRLFAEEQEAGISNKIEPPSQAILDTIARIDFSERHLGQWPVWSGECEHGTALVVGDINYDLKVELDEKPADSSARGALDRFFETLTSFVDPFVDLADARSAAAKLEFAYAVRAWDGAVPRLIVGAEKQFDRRTLDGMEHLLFGRIDADGVFTGKVKAFGNWIEGDCVIEPPKDLIIPRRADSEVGPFEIYVASMEFVQLNSSLPKAEFERYKALAEKYSGFMIFRDGLRVLPYGREDNDFFEIESRRSKSAGREFWNHRQMFGRLSIRRDRNPNLKDKAGREGLLDNRAAKTLKILVSNVLMTSARRYYGSASDFRAEMLPQLQASNQAGRASEARNKLRQRQRKEFRSKLQAYVKDVPKLNREMEAFARNIQVRDESDIAVAQQQLEAFRERINDYKLPGAPKNLGTLESVFGDYRDSMRDASVLAAAIAADLEAKIELVSPAQPRDLLEKQIARNAAQIHRRIQGWRKSVDTLQKAEFERIRELVAERNKVFHAEAPAILARFDRGEIGFSEAAKLLDRMKSDVDSANEDMFVPYIGALESLKESIDLEHLAMFGMEEVSELRMELERLNALAQLGIAVEIVGHELQAYDDIIGAALAKLPADVRETKAAKDIEFGFDGLTDQLRFLSPLRLAGQRIQRWITGEEVFKYLSEFFKLHLSKGQIALEATSDFLQFRVFDQQSRLFPVFINLVNNSIYWVGLGQSGERRILLSVVGDEVAVSDNGPGVDAEDVANLFGLFFTRKARGGRGVGLYLSRANLAAGGHRIRYEVDGGNRPLPGANFLIAFKGAQFNAG